MQFRIPRLTAKLSRLDFDQQQNIFKTTEKFKKSKRSKNDCENNQVTKMGSIFGVNSGGEFALKISNCKVGKLTLQTLICEFAVLKLE